MQASGRTDEHDETSVACHNFANAPKNRDLKRRTCGIFCALGVSAVISERPENNHETPHITALSPG